jgi:Icc-related predicted phosphoesterase
MSAPHNCPTDRATKSLSMKIHVISDLHLEHRPLWRMAESVTSFDVAVVAGDVDGSVRRAVETLATAPALQGKPVIFVPGNHEYYGSILQDNLADGMAAAEGTRVHILHRRMVVIGGVRFIGATLWTDYFLHGAPKVSMKLAGHELNDHRLIRWREDGGHISRFMPWHARREHLADRAFLEAALRERHDRPTIVVTHHLPSGNSIAKRFAGSPLNPAFASSLDAMIRDTMPACWIHGHTHQSCDYMLAATRVLCNPKGYGPHPNQPRIESEAFDPRLVIDIDG